MKIKCKSIDPSNENGKNTCIIWILLLFFIDRIITNVFLYSILFSSLFFYWKIQRKNNNKMQSFFKLSCYAICMNQTHSRIQIYLCHLYLSISSSKSWSYLEFFYLFSSIFSINYELNKFFKVYLCYYANDRSNT